MREHRLYQADWLMRFYGFEREEITAAAPDGMLDLTLDPKLAWALANRGRFPMDVNIAPRELLLRIPGLGAKTVDRLIDLRRHKRLGLDDLRKLSGSIRRLRAFVVADGWTPGAILDGAELAEQLRSSARHATAAQLSLF